MFLNTYRLPVLYRNNQSGVFKSLIILQNIRRGRRPDVPKGYIFTELKNVGDGAPDVPNGLFD